MKIVQLCLWVTVFCWSTRSNAEVVVFGDSLCDTGNFAIASGGALPPTPLYAAGRFSNGPVWVEELAEKLREPVPMPSLANGTNFAFNGARAFGVSPYGVPDVATQVAAYLASNDNSVDPCDWFVIWAGANDIFFGAANGEADFIPNAVVAIQSSVVQLRQAGARRILVLNLPPLGQTPFFNQDPILSAQFDAAAFGFNRALEDTLQTFRGRRGRQFVVLGDIEGLFNSILRLPHRFRLQNTTDSCTIFDRAGTGLGIELKDGVDPNRYLFWDSIHPTERGHAIIAKAAYFQLRFGGIP